MRKITEADVEGYLVGRVKALGGEIRKLVWLGRRHAPDRVVMYKGAHFVELKKPDEEPRDGQKREHKRMKKLGLKVYVLDCYKKVDDFIRKIQ